MKKIALWTTYFYMLCCPLEFVLNVWFGSSVKFIALGAVVVTAFYFLTEQERVIRFGATQFCLLGWAGLEAVSVLWTNVSKTTYSTLTSYLMMTAFVVLLSLFPFEKKEADRLIMFYSLGTLVLSLVLLIMGQVDGSASIGRMTVSILGKNQDPNGLAAIVLSGAFYSLYKVFESKKLFILYAIAFILQTVAIFYTGSRGGLVAYAIALVVFVVVKIPKKGRIPAFLGSVILIVAGYFILEATLPERLFNRLFDLSSYLSGSGVGRVKIWTTALNELMKSPAFGFGTTSHLSFFSESLGKELAMHNTFLCVMFEVGLVGLLLFIEPFVSAVRVALKNKNVLIISVIVANLMAAMFLDALYVRFLWNAMIFGIVYKNIMQTEKKDEKEKKA